MSQIRQLRPFCHICDSFFLWQLVSLLFSVWSGRRDSNSHIPAWKAKVIPLYDARIVVGFKGNDDLHAPFVNYVRHICNCFKQPTHSPSSVVGPLNYLERAAGLEPATSWMATRCSTRWTTHANFGPGSRIWTYDLTAPLSPLEEGKGLKRRALPNWAIPGIIYDCVLCVSASASDNLDTKIVNFLTYDHYLYHWCDQGPKPKVCFATL